MANQKVLTKAAPGETPDDLRDWAEVPFVPSEASESRDTEPLRYVAVRVRPRQGELFADGSAVKHFVVLSNQWDWDGARLTQWIEAVSLLPAPT